MQTSLDPFDRHQSSCARVGMHNWQQTCFVDFGVPAETERSTNKSSPLCFISSACSVQSCWVSPGCPNVGNSASSSAFRLCCYLLVEWLVTDHMLRVVQDMRGQVHVQSPPAERVGGEGFSTSIQELTCLAALVCREALLEEGAHDCSMGVDRWVPWVFA